jgi:hypothetical protein
MASTCVGLKGHDLPWQVYKTCSQMLLPVLPHLSSELRSADVPRRLKAVEQVARLFTMPGCDADALGEDLFSSLMDRYRDSQVCTCRRLDSAPSATLVAG